MAVRIKVIWNEEIDVRAYAKALLEVARTILEQEAEHEKASAPTGKEPSGLEAS